MDCSLTTTEAATLVSRCSTLKDCFRSLNNEVVFGSLQAKSSANPRAAFQDLSTNCWSCFAVCLVGTFHA